MIYDSTLLIVNPDENLIITSEKKKTRSKLPPFTMLGRGEYMNSKHGYPSLSILLNLNRAEQWFLSHLFNSFNINTNLAVFPNTGLNPTEIKRKASAYKSLNAKDFVKRTKKGEFMINPKAIISPNHYEKLQIEWDSL